jgi:hypothetical protein
MTRPKREVDRLGELEDALKATERRIDELRDERDKSTELIGRMREALDNHSSTMDQWKEAFNMTLDKVSNTWTFEDGSGDQYHALLVQYRDLLRDWNKHVDDFNATIAPKAPGRPLNASPAQCEQVLKLRKRKLSLRDISEEMTLAVATVRTIIARDAGTDRTTLKTITPTRSSESAAAGGDAPEKNARVTTRPNYPPDRRTG